LNGDALKTRNRLAKKGAIIPSHHTLPLATNMRLSCLWQPVGQLATCRTVDVVVAAVPVVAVAVVVAVACYIIHTSLMATCARTTTSCLALPSLP